MRSRAVAGDGRAEAFTQTDRASENLASVVGERTVLTLIEHFGGRRIRIPTMRSYLRVKRNRQIIEALRHSSYVEVAGRFGISVSTVQRVAGSLSPLSQL